MKTFAILRSLNGLNRLQELLVMRRGLYRTWRRVRSGLGGVTLLALMAAGASSAAWAQQAEKPKAEAPAEAVRPELGAIFQTAQDQLKAGNAPGALTALLEADKIADRTPFENLSLNRVRGSIALVARDFALARRSLEAVVNDPRLTPPERRSTLQSLVVASQRLNDHGSAVRHARAFFEAGGQSEAMRGALVRSLFSLKDWAAVAQEAPRAAAEIEAAGRKPDEELLKIWATATGETKNEAGYFVAIEALVRHHPSPDYWGDLISRLQNRPGFADRLVLDSLRLMRQTESMVDADEFTSLAQLATVAALPGEASQVLEEGFKAGILGKGQAAANHRELRARAAKAAAEDKAAFAQAEAAAEKSGDASRLFAIGEAALSYGMGEKALALMDKAIAMGIRRHAEDAQLRYGVALLKSGKRAQAEPILRGLKGSDGTSDLARLWLLAVR